MESRSRSGVAELPTLPSVPSCPAAAKIVGVAPCLQGCVCRVMRRDHEQDAGLGMSAAASGFIQHEATGGVYLNLKSDPATVANFCFGRGLPVITDDDVAGGRDSYTYCPVWQAEVHRVEEGRKQLLTEPEPEPVAAGVTVDPFEDPWQMRRDLEAFGARS